MKREDFIFTIGYQGDTALVDGSARRQFGKLSTHELAEKGLLKPALCSALYSNNQQEIDEVVAAFRERSGISNLGVDQLKRTLGVYTVPERTLKIKIL